MSLPTRVASVKSMLTLTQSGTSLLERLVRVNTYMQCGVSSPSLYFTVLLRQGIFCLEREPGLLAAVTGGGNFMCTSSERLQDSAEYIIDWEKNDLAQS